MNILWFSIPEVVAKPVFLGVVLVAALVTSRLLARTIRRVLGHANVPSASIFVNVIRALVWVFALLIVLKPVFGIEPTAFVTALGITSVALSLGLQDTISNLFGGFTLMAGKVIIPGDIVTISGTTGEVIDINWRSTTVQQFNGDLQVIPNSVLSKTELTKLAPFQAGECPLPVILAKDADFEQVRTEVESIARAALGSHYDEEFGAPVLIREFSNLGTLATISLHCKSGISPSEARTVVAQELIGKSWLA